MAYIYNKEDGYIKKCKTDDCPNEIFVGVSAYYCCECVTDKGIKVEIKLIPEFNQKRIM